jgi:hypothetical protein
MVKEKLGNNYNPNFIKDLNFTDMETPIYWLPQLKKNDSNYRKILEDDHREMHKRKKIPQI